MFSSAARTFIAGESTILGGDLLVPFSLCSPPGTLWSSVQFTSLAPPDPRAHWLMFDPNCTFDNCRMTQGQETSREFPVVLPGEAIRGNPQAIRVWGPTSSIVSVFASFVHGAPPVSLPVGDVWLDPGLVLHIGTGAVDTNRRLTVTTTIPGWLRVGEVLVYQAASLSQQSLWEISQPGFAVVRDP